MAYDGWDRGRPPRAWPRALAMDVGGASANNLEWFAQDPESKCIVAYAEVNMVTTDMRLLATKSLPHMKYSEDEEYEWLFKVGDYENRIALDDMRRHGIRFTDAVKHNKTLSIQRLSGYLHPNPKRPYPTWHPRAGQLGSPLMFITPACPQLIKEIPLQKWKEGQGDTIKDEMDRAIRHDAVDCALYVARLLPAPAEIPLPKVRAVTDIRDIQSKLYWEDVKRQEAKKSSTAPRKPYSISHDSGGVDWKRSLLGF